MFTLEAYWKEYLSKRDRFTPPSESFRPSTEATTEVVYSTPLISSQAPAGKTSSQSGESDIPVDALQEPRREDDMRYYVIDEEADVDELINQIKESGKFRAE
jgi:hypothetical protein